LPPYAPELNPVEFLWGWLKYSRLNNFAPRDALQLDDRIAAELAAIQNDQALFLSFVQASGLPIRLTLLS
jgi:transposase